MTLYDRWNRLLSDETRNSNFWNSYLATETTIYEDLLSAVPSGEGRAKHIPFSTTVAELAGKYRIEPVLATGFVDGINESLETPIDLEKLEEDTPISSEIHLARLFQNMIKAKAEWLYTLEQWEPIFDADERKALRREYIDSITAKSEKIAGRNDPCPCGSGKKYKKCCLNKGEQ